MAFAQAPGQGPGQYPYPAGEFQGAPQGYPTPGYPAQGYAPQAPPQSSGRGGLALFGSALAAYLLLELLLLVSDVVKYGPSMIITVFGLGNNYAYGPVGFFAADLGISVVVAICAVGAFMGRGWSRLAAPPLVAVFSYSTFTQLLNQAVTHTGGPALFSSPWYSYLTLLGLAEVGLGVIIVIVGAVVGRGGRPAFPQQSAPGYAAPPMQMQMPQQPVPAQQQYPQQHQQPMPQQQYPPAPPQQGQQPQQPQAQQPAGEQPYGYGYPPPLTHPMTQLATPAQPPQQQAPHPAPQPQPGYGYPQPPTQPPGA